MKITIQTTVTEEKEITLPTYRKTAHEIVCINGTTEKDVLRLWTLNDSVSFGNLSSSNINQFFESGWKAATAEDFYLQLKESINHLEMFIPAEFMQQPEPSEIGHTITADENL